MPTKKVETQEASPPQDIFEMNMRALEPGYFISTGFPRYGHHYGDMSRWFNNCDGYTPEIRRACWHSYHTNGFIRAATDFWVSLPTLDRTIQTKDRKRDGVSLPNNFLRDKQKMSASLDRLRDKVIMRDALLKYRLDGAAAYYFTTNQRYSNQKFIDPIYWALRYELNAYNNDIEYNKDIADKKFNEINEEQKEIFLKRLDEYALGYAQVEENKSKKSSRKEKSVESNAVNIGVQNCTLFPLNIDYVRFIGLRDGSFQIAFDLWYFYQYNVYDMVERLLSFPREIIQAWRQYQSGRARSNWFILPIENTVVCKSGAMNSPVHIPLTAGALDWVAYGNSFQRTKHNVMSNMINNSLIYQEFPRKDNNGNTSLLTQEQQQAQHEKIKSVLNTPNINDEFIRRFFSVAPGTKLNEMKFDTSIFDTINEPLIAENTTGSLGVGLGLLTGNSGNYASLKLNIDIQMSLAHGVIEQLEADLNKVLNHHIIKNKSCYVECKYSADSYISRSQQVANNLDLYRNAKGSLEALIASIGHEPEGYLSLMENEKDLDYENRYPTHMTSFTQSNRDESISVDKTEELDIIDDPGGRPVVENPTTDKTMSTIDNDGNSTPRANI